MQTINVSAPSYTSRAAVVNVPAGGRVTLNMALTPWWCGGAVMEPLPDELPTPPTNNGINLALVQGGGNSTRTDFSGNYTLTMAAGSQAIQASADGFVAATQKCECGVRPNGIPQFLVDAGRRQR
jgi:hypothetical protein